MLDYFDKVLVLGMAIKDCFFDLIIFVFVMLKKGIFFDIDGILGLEFLVCYCFVINYYKKIIYFWLYGLEINYC